MAAASQSISQRRNATAPKPLNLCTVPLDDSVRAFSPTTIPSIAYQPADSTSSVNTYSSTFSAAGDASSSWPPLADDSLADTDDEDDSEASKRRRRHQQQRQCPLTPRRPSFSSSDDAIPVALPPYRAKSAGAVRQSDPKVFGKLFPSMDRLSVRHDDQSSDGNMSLRIDATTAAGFVKPGLGARTTTKCTAVQLFHLRMHDLARREFSLRRYGRDSGREVASSKREYIEPSGVYSALRTVKAPFRRSRAGLHSSSAGAGPLSPSFRKRSVGTGDDASVPLSPRDNHQHPPTASASASLSVSTHANVSAALQPQPQSHQQLPPLSPVGRPVVATDTIKLEFSNYARVDVRRCHNKRYEFEWWGHNYAWRRDVDKVLGGVSFHLIRDGQAAAPVAHIVPETRSPNQVDAEETAGGWIPPCYMWISDPSVVEAVTDVADVIVVTGLIALVDDSIKERWSAKKTHGSSARRPSITSATTPRTSFMQGLFRRSRTDNSQQQPPRHQRKSRPVSQLQPQDAAYSRDGDRHEQRRHSMNAPVFKTPEY